MVRESCPEIGFRLFNGKTDLLQNVTYCKVNLEISFLRNVFKVKLKTNILRNPEEPHQLVFESAASLDDNHVDLGVRPLGHYEKIPGLASSITSLSLK